ncbi:MAG: ABC transporter permease [Actinobacteria bacterium]|nr:ABC transporter permease [Actinomycetota bacterium]
MNSKGVLVSKFKLNFKLTPEIGALIALAIISLVLTFLTKYFFTLSNFINLIRQVSIIGIAGVGATFVIISGGIDLSIGSMISFLVVLLASFIQNYGISSPVAFLFVLLIGATLGLVNGIMIAFLRMPPIIATLSTWIAYKGAALVYSGGYAIPLIGKFEILGRGFLGPIPVPSIIMIGVTIVGFIILKYTMLGRVIYGLGGNEEAVYLSGISVKKYRLIIYMISGITAGVASGVMASRLASGQPMSGDGVELDVIAAAVLGGTNIFGGSGSVWGTIVGAFILTVIGNGLNLLNVNPYGQFIAKGAILAFAVAINSIKGFRQS